MSWHAEMDARAIPKLDFHISALTVQKKEQ